MPKVRVRTTEKASWSSDSLDKAIQLIDGGSSIRNAAKAMGIPFSSLQKRIKKGSSVGPHLGRFTVFSPEAEAELANLVKKMANIFNGCNANQIRKVAFEYAEKLNLKHNFNQASKMAGRDWLHAFMARNNISVRKPEATSINRITAFNKTEVSLFFELLGQLMEKHRFVAKNIYNCDETGISTVQTPGKILAAEGQKRVGSITSWERGKNITLLCAMSSAGGYIPPMFIFPRKRMTPLLEKDGPAGALYKCSDNGWINEHLFLEWLAHFKQHAKPSTDEPILLILDNHASHISLSVYEYCKSNHIHMLSLPPHTSHRMQPLDVSFFGPLKMAYKKECDLFLKSHLAEKITPYDVASLVRKAFNNVASISKGESGFRSTGIFPLNPELFTEEVFLAAETLQYKTVVIQDCNESLAATCVIPSTSKEDSPVPSTSTQIVSPDLMMSNQEDPLDSESNVVPQVPGTPNQYIILHDLIKIPEKASVIKTRQGRKKQHATILTSTPLKENLLEKEINKMKKKGGKEKEKTWKGKGQGKNTKVQKKGPEKAKRQVLQEQNETSVSDVGTDDLCQEDEDDDAEDAGNRCLVCDEFGRNNELWYRCTSCGLTRSALDGSQLKYPDPAQNKMLDEDIIIKAEDESDEGEAEENNRDEEEEETTEPEEAMQTEPTPPRSQSHKRIKGMPSRSRLNQCNNVNQCCKKSTRQLLHSISRKVETLATGDAFDAFGRYVAAMLRAQPARAARLQARVVTLLTAHALLERDGFSTTRRQRMTKNKACFSESDESVDEII